MMESIFTIIVIMICFGICMMIFASVASGSSSTLKVKARVQLQSEADRCKADHELSNASFAQDEYIIERTFTPAENNSDLIEMKLLAKNPEGIILAEYHELLLP
jgi:hypothetical protein